MTTELDLDDVAATSPLAAAELADLRASAARLALDRAEFRRDAEQLRADLTEARRLLDEARITLVGIATVTPKYWELPRDQFIHEFLPWAQIRARDAAAKIATPVPAQPEDTNNG